MIIGIDNGLQGGITALKDDGTLEATWLMPIIVGQNKKDFDVNIISFIFTSLKKKCDENNELLHVILEQAHPRPVQGVRASFTTGFCYGMMQGILSSLKISYEIISPQEWMRELKISSKDEKGSIKWCVRKYPHHLWKKSEACKNYHDGLTDSCSLSYYGWLKRNQNDK